ncbi:hypothetical protein GQ55_4G345400 [Panicum hallii var. hallii]|uniref:Uncharacterized protein n=1 Tax=Panicum hallii var. hallii TaxID=1504633 RepID=A0A2T7E375_9POAL|nr:hypothetical protein GQ55_4G345400 [Panicum hallii var. hallii]
MAPGPCDGRVSSGLLGTVMWARSARRRHGFGCNHLDRCHASHCPHLSPFLALSCALHKHQMPPVNHRPGLRPPKPAPPPLPSSRTLATVGRPGIVGWCSGAAPPETTERSSEISSTWSTRVRGHSFARRRAPGRRCFNSPPNTTTQTRDLYVKMWINIFTQTPESDRGY